MLILQAPVVIVGIGALAAVTTGLIDATTGLTVFGAAFIVSVAVSVWTMRTFRCPECGQRLLPPRGWWHRFPGAALFMRCVRCDVDWDFGLRGPQD
jgi:hypothetical protein